MYDDPKKIKEDDDDMDIIGSDVPCPDVIGKICLTPDLDCWECPVHLRRRGYELVK